MTELERELKVRVRLNQLTTEYLSLEQEKEKYYREHINDMSRTTITTLYLMQEYIDTVIRQIIIRVGQCMRNDWDIDNEVATLVYNYYEPQIRRGLGILLGDMKVCV